MSKKHCSIPSTLTDREKRLLSTEVAEIVNDGKLDLSFRYYNDKCCEISDLNTAKAKAALKHFRMMGDCSEVELRNQGIKQKPIRDQGEYHKYFSKLPVSYTGNLYEDKPSSDSRIMYFVDRQKIFVVAIVANHNRISQNFR